MQQGIQSLMPQGPQQGPMPGQAPQMPMPGMMPQPSAPTPGAMTGSLKNMPLDQLKMLYQNPQPGSPPLWAVISALAEKQKEAQAMQAARGQSAMAQNAQMQQQPPIAAQVMQAAEQQPVMAAHGGMMRGYAGGGAVAFDRGGLTLGYDRDYMESRDYGINLSPYDPPEVRAEKLERLRIARETGVAPPPGERESAVAKDASGIAKALKFAASPFAAAGAAAADVAGLPINLVRKYSLPGVSTGQESLTPVIDMLRRQEPAKGSGRGAMNPPMATSEESQQLAERMNAPTQFALDPNNPQVLNALRRAAMTAGGKEREDLLAQIAQMQSQLPQGEGTSEPSGVSMAAGQETPARPTFAQTPVTGLPALSAERQAQIKKDQEEAETLARARQELAQKMGTASSEVLASRENLQRVLSGAYDPQRKALEEAKAAQAQGLFGNAEALGRMAAAASRGKRFGQVLGEAVGAGSEFMGEQRKRIQSLQDRYNDLTAQLNITMAQAQHADIVGDDKLKRDAMMKAEDIKAELFNTQRAIRQGAVTEQAQQATGIAALQKSQADLASVSKPSPQAQLLRDLGLQPTLENVERLARAQYGAKGDAARDRNDIARQRLLNEDMVYAGARMAYVNATDPVKKADALRKMKEIERLNGIVDEGEQTSPTQLPPGVTVKRVGP